MTHLLHKITSIMISCNTWAVYNIVFFESNIGIPNKASFQTVSKAKESNIFDTSERLHFTFKPLCITSWGSLSRKKHTLYGVCCCQEDIFVPPIRHLFFSIPEMYSFLAIKLECFYQMNIWTFNSMNHCKLQILIQSQLKTSIW